MATALDENLRLGQVYSSFGEADRSKFSFQTSFFFNFTGHRLILLLGDSTLWFLLFFFKFYNLLIIFWNNLVSTQCLNLFERKVLCRISYHLILLGWFFSFYLTVEDPRCNRIHFKNIGHKKLRLRHYQTLRRDHELRGIHLVEMINNKFNLHNLHGPSLILFNNQINYTSMILS